MRDSSPFLDTDGEPIGFWTEIDELPGEKVAFILQVLPDDAGRWIWEIHRSNITSNQGVCWRIFPSHVADDATEVITAFRIAEQSGTAIDPAADDEIIPF